MKVFRFWLIGILILTISCCGTQKPPVITAPSGKVLATPRNDIAGVGNLAKISDTLYRGAQPTKEGFAELKKMGIKTIINLREWHNDRDLIKGLGFQYLEIPSNAGDVSEEHIIRFIKAATDPAAGIVFVHCHHGSDRTGLMVGVYRIYVQGWSNADAVAELANFGYHEFWYGNIRDYLQKFDPAALRPKVETAPAPKFEAIP